MNSKRGTGKTERMLRKVAGRAEDHVLVVGGSHRHAAMLKRRFDDMVEGASIVRHEVRRPDGGVVEFVGMPDRPTPFLGRRLPIYVDHYVYEEVSAPMGVWDAIDRADTRRATTPTPAPGESE